MGKERYNKNLRTHKWVRKFFVVSLNDVLYDHRLQEASSAAVEIAADSMKVHFLPVAAETGVLVAVVVHTDSAANSVPVAGIVPAGTAYFAVARTEARSAVLRSDYRFVLKQHALHGHS